MVPTPNFEGRHSHSSRREEVLWNRGLSKRYNNVEKPQSIHQKIVVNKLLF